METKEIRERIAALKLDIEAFEDSNLHDEAERCYLEIIALTQKLVLLKRAKK